MKRKMTFKRIIINLKVISDLKPGQKLNTKYELFSIENGVYYYVFFISPLRWFSGDNRTQCTISIMNLIKTAAKMIDDNTANNSVTNAYLLEHLSMSKKGIINLQKSYIDDAKTKASLQRCSDKIDEILSSSKM
jgi:hypothetical protein